MLFGDWGTSRLYVLGFAFFYAGYSSIWYMAAMSVLLIAVGWAYEVICRQYPEGGGVYSAARHRSHLLGVIGALLLCADYVVTASLSALEAFHYLGVHHEAWWAAGGIILIGVINYFGPTKAGTLALIVAVATVIFSIVISAFAVPHLANVHIEPITHSPGESWAQFTRLILAISGVEAVANMTGIMVKPVERTARLSIYPVLAEIVILNLVLSLAVQAMPKDKLFVTPEVAKQQAEERGETPQAPFETGEAKGLVVNRDAHDTMLNILAKHYVGPRFAAIAALTFAALLLSAVNTAVTDLVSIQYMMSTDRELPTQFRKLNIWGMPVTPLVLGTVVPALIVLLVPSTKQLADLYAIGVVGAVAINLGACSTNFSLPLRSWERWPMVILSVVMAAIWLTIAFEKPHALLFAAVIMIAGLSGRAVAHHYRHIGKMVVEPMLEMVEKSAAAAQLMVSGESARKKRLLVSTYGNMKLLSYAIGQAKLQEAELLVLFVRYIAVIPMGDVKPEDWHDDPAAAKMFGDVAKMAKEEGVKIHYLYAQSHDIAGMILDMAATYGVTELFLGTTQRGSLWRTMKGDVIQQVAQYLPEPIKLIIHA